MLNSYSYALIYFYEQAKHGLLAIFKKHIGARRIEKYNSSSSFIYTKKPSIFLQIFFSYYKKNAVDQHGWSSGSEAQ
jgi:hypothetical protein